MSGLTFCGQQPADLGHFFHHHGLPHTLAHSLRVAQTALELALRFGADPDQAQLAGWLHDCSAVIPTRQRLSTAREWGIEVLAEEEAFPLVLHQMLSVVIAREIFKIQDEPVLSAIGCHTTLKVGASGLDLVIFVADKLSWDQAGDPPYKKGLESGLAQSLEAAALAYLDYLYETKKDIPGGLHPWVKAARAELSAG